MIGTDQEVSDDVVKKVLVDDGEQPSLFRAKRQGLDVKREEYEDEEEEEMEEEEYEENADNSQMIDGGEGEDDEEYDEEEEEEDEEDDDDAVAGPAVEGSYDAAEWEHLEVNIFNIIFITG